MPSDLRIACLVRGQNSSAVFIIRIPLGASVSTLQQAIQEKLKEKDATDDATQLILWKVPSQTLAGCSQF